MDKIKILQIIRSGEGELRPIIDYYAHDGDIRELADNIDDKEVSSTIFYIMSEMPKVHPDMISIINDKLKNGALSPRDMLWAQEIVDNG